MRNTKIVATLGPATSSREQIEALAREGVNVFRLNFSHGSHKGHEQNIKWIRKARKSTGENIAILADLCGPKIRVSTLDAPIQIREGETVRFAPKAHAAPSDIPTAYAGLAGDLVVGNDILINDGLLKLEVTAVNPPFVSARVIEGGLVESRKGINLPGVQVNTPALTDSDKKDLKFALSAGVEYVALSFVQRPQDVQDLKDLLPKDDMPDIIAKIEKDTALRHLDEILELSDGVMVARGDLGVELPFSKVPAIQKRIIERAIFFGRPVITATQMLESMIENPRPTRAEANDVANAVYDRTDAVMLSGETAVGKHPLKAVRAMAEIITEAELTFEEGARGRLNSPIDRRHTPGGSPTQHAIAAATVDATRMVDAPAIVAITSSSASAKLVSSYRPSVPIVAVSQNESAVRKLALVWGVTSVHCSARSSSYEKRLETAQTHLLSTGLGQLGQRFVVTAGFTGIPGTTNALRIEEL